jgi:diacylglycerol kinase (ATP)
MQDAVIILNPTSGKHRIQKVLQRIKHLTNGHSEHIQIQLTKYPGHATELVQQVDNPETIVVAAGGDGTVNEVAKGLSHKSNPMGILPFGSGNGLARHLGIPLHLSKSIDVLFEGKQVELDTWKMESHDFYMLGGLGFDAFVAYKIKRELRKGFQAYVKGTYKAIREFKPSQVRLSWESGSYEGKPFMVNLSNGSQFGNNFFIAPDASIKDGVLDVGILEPFPGYRIPELIIRMLTRTIKGFRYYNSFQTNQVLIQTKYNLANIDGESFEIPNEIWVKASESPLKVIVPKTSMLSI